MPPFSSLDVLDNGRHHFSSRNGKDGYSIDELVAQLESGLDDASKVVKTPRGPALQNPTLHFNEAGKQVNDRAVLIGGRGDRPGLFSVIPIGDGKK
ncbi:hypothetical protein [Zoogloea sp.]|uniref:hypothetical protein n=1 Tax=Zoogloea sp. TaxID=49181 RepID=UPI00322067E5